MEVRPLQSPRMTPRNQNANWVMMMMMMGLFLSWICCAIWTNRPKQMSQQPYSTDPRTKNTTKCCWQSMLKQPRMPQTKLCQVLLWPPKNSSKLLTQESTTWSVMSRLARRECRGALIFVALGLALRFRPALIRSISCRG
mgnify:CR=1 FL=1